MKLSDQEYKELKKSHSKEYADYVAGLTGFRSAWWQICNNCGPNHAGNILAMRLLGIALPLVVAGIAVLSAKSWTGSKFKETCYSCAYGFANDTTLVDRRDTTRRTYDDTPYYSSGAYYSSQYDDDEETEDGHKKHTVSLDDGMRGWDPESEYDEDGGMQHWFESYYPTDPPSWNSDY